LIIVDTALEQRERDGKPIRIALIGAGYMGRGIARQIIIRTMGMRLVGISSRSVSDALRAFIAQADEVGILVMCSGIVGSNTHRKLDPQEFRGFAMADPLAPVVFINGADTRSAQMFTLAHELAHIWLGQSALSDAEARFVPDHEVERWCNHVAAELLVPLEVVRSEFHAGADLAFETNRLARRFKVSTLVVLRRIHDAGGLSREQLWGAYDAELERLQTLPAGSGGNFYVTLPARVSRRFATGTCRP